MDFNISEEEKTRMKQEALLQVERELYTELLIVGIDPDTFDLSFLDNDFTEEEKSKFFNLDKIVKRIKYLKTI